MTELTIHWPDEAAERVAAARGRLEVAAPELARRTLEERTRVLGAVLTRWRDPASPERRALLEAHPAASGFSRETLEAGLALGLEPLTAQALEALVERELAPALAAGLRLRPFATTSVLLAGAIPMPALLQIVLSLVAGSPVLVRPSARDTTSAELVRRSIEAVDRELGRAVAVVDFPSDDSDAMASFCASPCIVASGSDATLHSIRARIHAGQRLVAYSNRHSIAVVDASQCEGAQLGWLAEALSLDVALWDQLGCLSPTAVCVLGQGAADVAPRLARTLAEQLAQREVALPRGAVDASTAALIATARGEAEMRVAAAGAGALHASPGTAWTVSLEPDALWRATPLHRFVRVYALASTTELDTTLVGAGVGVLSNVALAGFDAATRERLHASLCAHGASRFCAPGLLQAPPLDWPHDGQPLLTPLVRLVHTA